MHQIQPQARPGPQLDTPKDVIQALGGVRAVATRLGLNQRTVWSWVSPERGIPPKYFLDVLAVAEAMAVPLCMASLHALKRQPNPKATQLIDQATRS